ncbi:hypothetical protein KOW79_012045 [Hemibagrus wyckioides]|uniref:Solute carrier family 15 member 5 n=2 Tax=Hemibagrus wyckioides TaxID=337641 RepID=A0A9D3NLE7_9TELE|nr:hypothetical protein KOW79_012045 [Hemibagrus wyckioides]
MVALNVAGLHDSHLLQKDSTTCHPKGKVIPRKPRKPRKKVKAIICVLFVELIERIYWLVNLNSTVIFLGIAYIQQSVGKNLGFFIPFTSVLLGLIGMHMARSNLILHPRKGGSLLTTVGVVLNSSQMCCLRYRHLSGDVTDWLDRAKENNGGCYSETKVENVKILVKLFPLFGLQLLYRVCITQIPSGYYLQTMHSNLNINGVMLPIAAMNVISILPLLILAPLLEFVSICYQYSKKTPPSPVTFIIIGHACAALSALVAGISELHRKHYPQMDQTISGTVLEVSSMPCIHLAPQYILLGVAEAFVTPACSVISFCLTPSNLRGIALQFLTLSYGGGCFLGALLIQFFYFVSGVTPCLGLCTMDLPEPIRRRLGEFSRTVFVNQGHSQLSPEDHTTFLNHNTDVVSSLPLQMALFFNMCFFPLWWISEVVMLQLKYPALPDYYKFILITILILMTLIEVIRLYLGYAGNLQEKVPELAGFWLLSLLLQFPLILFQLFNEAILIQPLERGVHIVLALFILTEALSGFVALRAMVRHTESRFHLSQFNGIQELRS